jgi:hypothetical protein
MNAFHKNTDLKKLHLNGGFEIFTALKIQVEVFWVVMPYSVVVGHQHFREPCCLHLQGEVK